MVKALEIPESLLRQAEELAQRDGVSLDTWVSSMIAYRIGAAEATEQFFRMRAAGAGKGLQYYLDLVPKCPPDPGDELPEGWTAQ